MKRITISLPDDVATAIDREARRCGKSQSAVVRDAVESSLGFNRQEVRKLPFANLGASGHRDTAERAEEILAQEWAHDRRS